MPSRTYTFTATPPDGAPVTVLCTAANGFEATIITRAAIRQQMTRPTHLTAPVLLHQVDGVQITTTSEDDHARAVLATWDASGVGVAR